MLLSRPRESLRFTIVKRNHQLLSAILNSPFFMAADAVEGYLPSVVALLEMKDEDDAPEKLVRENELAKLFAAGEPFLTQAGQYDFEPVLLGTTLLIPVMDALMQYDFCWSAGTATIANWYRMAAADDRVERILEISNSPGGSVLGTAELAATKLSVGKPILTLCEGMTASAAYYIACGSDMIMATSPNCLVGSIGVMTTYQDWSKYHEARGVSIRHLYSKASPNKNFESRQAKLGNDKPYEEGTLYSLDKNFMAFVESRRPKLDKKALDGGTYTADAALTAGLIDKIGSFEDAIAALSQLKPKSQSPNNMAMNFKAGLIAMLSAFGMVAATKADGAEKTEEELLAELKAKLDAQSAENTRLKPFEAQVTELQASLKAEQDAHNTTKTSLAAKDTEIENLKGELAKTPAQPPVTPKGEKESTEEGDKGWEAIAATLAHNKNADRVLG